MSKWDSFYAKFFFPRVILICLYKEPQTRKPQMAPYGLTEQTQKPINWKPQPQKPKFKTPTSIPQTTINEPKWEKNIKSNPGKKV